MMFKNSQDNIYMIIPYGKETVTNSHTDWWLYKDATPWEIFNVVRRRNRCYNIANKVKH